MIAKLNLLTNKPERNIVGIARVYKGALPGMKELSGSSKFLSMS
jgi:hypothetical protein